MTSNAAYALHNWVPGCRERNLGDFNWNIFASRAWISTFTMHSLHSLATLLSVASCDHPLTWQGYLLSVRAFNLSMISIGLFEFCSI